MRDRDLAWKISRIIVPFFMYFIIALIVQTVVGGIIVYNEMKSIGMADYSMAYTFFERLNGATTENAVLMTLITSLVMIPLLMYLMYRDELYKSIEPVNFSGYGTIVLLGVSGAMAVGRLVTLLPIDDIIGSYENTLHAIDRAPVSLQILTVIFVSPFMEEIFFRGLIYNRIKGYNDIIMATFLTAILFGVYHLNLVQGIYAFVMGIILCMVYERHKSILAPILLHIVANGTSYIIGHNPLSQWISNILIAEIIVTLVELVLFVLVVLLFIGVTDKKKNL